MDPARQLEEGPDRVWARPDTLSQGGRSHTYTHSAVLNAGLEAGLPSAIALPGVCVALKPQK
jgi:hypothetical protein